MNVLLVVLAVLLALPVMADAQIAVGGRVQTTSQVNVRSTPGGPFLGVQTSGVQGVVLAGPQSAAIAGSSDPTVWTWWQINYDTGTDGWTGANNLTVAAATMPPAKPSTPQLSRASGLRANP